MWILFACLSALFAAATSILAKSGIRTTDSDVATGLRTIVVLVFAWVMVLVSGQLEGIASIPPRTLLFLALSGLATGASWLCYFRALSEGEVNKVVSVDKSSTVLSVLFAILILGETDKLAVKLAGVALIGAGTYLMIERKKDNPNKIVKRTWLMYALLSAVFAALTSVLGKIGIDGVASNLGTAIRTCVVLPMAWVVVLVKGKQGLVKRVDGRELLFIMLSGVATGASWLCYYRALKDGLVSVVVPIDKMSILGVVLFSRVFFKERLSPKAGIGLGLICAGTLGMALL